MRAEVSTIPVLFSINRVEDPLVFQYRPSTESSDESDAADQYSLAQKIQSGMTWLINPCSEANSLQYYSKHYSDAECLKPQSNHVKGPLKYFTFGIMFTNGLFGLILFLIGLWSSFEHRKINHMPPVNAKDSTPMTSFHFVGIVFSVLGLLFFILCVISCLGINRENLSLLRISLFGQCSTLIIFVIFAVFVLVRGKTVKQKIVESMLIGLKKHYHTDTTWTVFFDQLHLNYFCCGVYSFNDWNDNSNYACKSPTQPPSLDACSVPFTCCKTGTTSNNGHLDMQSLSYTCGMNTLPSKNTSFNMAMVHERINVNGCLDEILPIIQHLIVTAAIFLLLICVIVFATMFLTCLLTFDIRLTMFKVQQCREKRQTSLEIYKVEIEQEF